jgi:hypothetical protein
MGEPATPTAKEREETRSLARLIVEAVRNDEAIPLIRFHAALEWIDRATIENLVLQLAQEIVLLDEAIEAVRKAHRG